MLEVAKNFLEYIRQESFGKSTCFISPTGYHQQQQEDQEFYCKWCGYSPNTVNMRCEGSE